MGYAFTLLDAIPGPQARRRGSRAGRHRARPAAPPTPNHRWTDEEREIVRRDYDGTRASAEHLAARLGVTYTAVKGQLQALGCIKITDRHRWNAADDERLADLISRYPPNKVAQKMGVGTTAVIVRAKRLGLSLRARDGWYTKAEVCAILGVDHHWVQRRIDSGELRARPHGDRQPQKDGMAMWHIAEADLRAFLRSHCAELNGRNVDLVQIVEILAGVQYMVTGEADRAQDPETEAG